MVDTLDKLFQYPPVKTGIMVRIQGIEKVAGAWLVNKAREQQKVSGTFQAAKNLRKQGVPLEVALAILRTNG